MAKLQDITTIEKAKELFTKRRPAEVALSSKFYEGDHWQGGKGWIGAAPDDSSRNAVLPKIKAAFVSENVIAEVIDRHVGGILGREPLWGFLPAEMIAVSTQARRRKFAKRSGLVATKPVPPAEDKTAQEADNALTIWWNTRRVRDHLKEALRIALAEEVAVIRFVIPRGLAPKGVVPDQKDLTSALNLIHLEVLRADKAGVFVDDDTQQEFGVYLSKDENEKQFAEITWVDGVGNTIARIVSEKQGPTEVSYELQGRLVMYEFRRKPLITEQVKSNQRSLNLALTMMMRNVNLAGSLERTVMNAERPTEIVRVHDDNEPTGYREEKREAPYYAGPGGTMFLKGSLIRNDAGEVIGQANPNIQFRDPVKVDTFIGTRDQFYASILGQCQQKHAMISGDAVVSGVSREQARGEYEGSLKDSSDVVDDAGRFILEVPLRMAAQFCKQVTKFAGLRCDFTSIVETGPVSPEMRTANRDDVEAGIISKETAMSENGRDDTDAEKDRIKAEHEEAGTQEEKDFNAGA